MPMYLVSMNLRRADPLLPVDQLTELVRGTQPSPDLRRIGSHLLWLAHRVPA
jgi:hypothetical protein